MNSFLQNDTDAEMDRYQEANEFSAAAFDPMAERVQKLRYNSTTRKNDIVLPMQAGGFFKIGEADLPQPDVMDAAPEKPLDMRVQDVKDYGAQVKEQQGSVSSEDLEAAGFDPQVIEMAEPKTLSTDAIAQALSDGTPMFDERDPNIRENGFFGTLDFLKDVGFDETSANFIADAMWGHKNPVGTGVMDFATLGIMDIQEGAQLYKDGKTTGSNVSKGLGIVLIAAGIAEATGVGVVVSKKIKANLPAIQKALQQMGTRLNQPGEMPTTSSFGVGEFAPGQSPQKLETPDINTQVDAARIAYESNPNDSSLKKQYLTLRRERDADPVAQIEAPTETKPGIIAFHGSGLNFNKFKLEKIGTGEGAQAFGYGLYFADSEDIANFYRQTVGGGFSIDNFSIGGIDLVKRGTYRDYSPGATPFGRGPYTPVNQLSAKDYALSSALEDIFIDEYDLYDLKKATGAGNIQTPKSGDELKQTIVARLQKTVDNKDPVHQKGEVEYLQGLISDIESGKAPIKFETEQHGHTYKVGLSLKQEDMLDYDKPLSEQPEKFKAALNEIAKIQGIPVVDQFGQSASFGSFQDALSQKVGPENTTREFTDAGIFGVKYRAAGSRGANVADADAGRNYVIFDDKMIKILEKYGIVGPVAIGAMAATPKEQQDET